MFVKIGGVLQLKDKSYRCVDASNIKRGEACKRCAFRTACTSPDLIDLECTKSDRRDSTDVYFERIPDSETKDLKSKKTTIDIFKFLSNYTGHGRKIVYKESSEGDGYGRFTLSLENDFTTFIEFRIYKGTVDSFQVYPSMKIYPTNQYYLRKLDVYSRFGKVDSVEL